MDDARRDVIGTDHPAIELVSCAALAAAGSSDLVPDA